MSIVYTLPTYIDDGYIKLFVFLPLSIGLGTVNLNHLQGMLLYG